MGRAIMTPTPGYPQIGLGRPQHNEGEPDGAHEQEVGPAMRRHPVSKTNVR